MSDRPVFVLTWPWCLAFGIVTAATQEALDLVTPTWLSWVGTWIAGTGILLLIAIARTPRDSR
jgi:hypothetical protein